MSATGQGRGRDGGDASARGGRGRGSGGGGSGARQVPRQGGKGSRGSGRGAGRGGGRGNGVGRGTAETTGDTGREPANPAAREVAAAAAAAASSVSRASDKLLVKAGEGEGEGEGEVCFICANPVAHHSIAPCNHTTCHICGLRMRALYKTKDCATCRTPAPFVIFTDDPERRFETYTEADITTTDSNIGIKYTNEDVVGDTILLLRYNCPDPACDFAGLGWPDLHRHVKSVHHKRMCDLCTRNKKVFTHEHELFSDRELERHMRRGDDRRGAADQTGFKGHPLCGFCGERFYDDDRLYEHCRMRHERCFICDRRDSRQPHYFLDYDALEQHFEKDHFLCQDRLCLEKKFVVFESELDLKAHNLSEHAGGRSAGRDARLVDMSGFDFRQPYERERRVGGDGRASRGRGRAGGARVRGGRDPDAEHPLSPPASRRDETAPQRTQAAIHSAQSVTTRRFGGQLSEPTPPSAPSAQELARRPQPTEEPATAAAVMDPMEALSLADTSRMSPEERARLVRHGSVIERAANLVGNDTSKMAAFREAISAYRNATAQAASQLIDSFFTIFADTSSNALGTLVREVADLFEDRRKADALRSAWQDWRSINEDYPSLPSLGGMHGATSSSSGWASAVGATTSGPEQRHSNRVLKLKNSTRLGGPAPSTPSPTGWIAPSSRPSSSSPSSSAFPSLPGMTSSSSRPSWLLQATPASAAASHSAPTSGRSTPRGGPSSDAFPALPSAPKPTTTILGYGSGRTVRRGFGNAESSFQWGQRTASETGRTDEQPADGGDKGKKVAKKGKKQVLVQWG